MPVSIGAAKLSELFQVFTGFSVQIQEGKQEKLQKDKRIYIFFCDF